jgi:hypothetical protein
LQFATPAHLSTGFEGRNSASQIELGEGFPPNPVDSPLQATQNATSSITTSPVRPYDVNSSILRPISFFNIRRTRGHLSVAGKLFGPDIVFVYFRITGISDCGRHHVTRAGNGIDGASH